jgi:hypothetical protein
VGEGEQQLEEVDAMLREMPSALAPVQVRASWGVMWCVEFVCGSQGEESF